MVTGEPMDLATDCLRKPDREPLAVALPGESQVAQYAADQFNKCRIRWWSLTTAFQDRADRTRNFSNVDAFFSPVVAVVHKSLENNTAQVSPAFAPDSLLVLFEQRHKAGLQLWR